MDIKVLIGLYILGGITAVFGARKIISELNGFRSVFLAGLMLFLYPVAIVIVGAIHIAEGDFFYHKSLWSSE